MRQKLRIQSPIKHPYMGNFESRRAKLLSDMRACVKLYLYYSILVQFMKSTSYYSITHFYTERFRHNEIDWSQYHILHATKVQTEFVRAKMRHFLRQSFDRRAKQIASSKSLFFLAKFQIDDDRRKQISGRIANFGVNFRLTFCKL